MERRKFLIGAGSAAIGTSALVGSGAFSSTAAEREVSVSVAGDQNAYLGIEPGDSPHAYTENGELKLDFDGSQAAGDGLNTNSFIKFNSLFTIRNNSPNKIAVHLNMGDGPEVPNGASATFQDQLAGTKFEQTYRFYWSFAREDQPAEYDPNGQDDLGNDFEFGLDDHGVLAPVNVNADESQGIFNRAGQHPAVLESGDKVTINFQINTKASADGNPEAPDPSAITNEGGTVVLNGYSREWAETIQSVQSE